MFDPNVDYPDVGYSSANLLVWYSMEISGSVPGGIIPDEGPNGIDLSTTLNSGLSLTASLGEANFDSQYVSTLNNYSLHVQPINYGVRTDARTISALYDFSPNKPFSISAHVNWRTVSGFLEPLIWRGAEFSYLGGAQRDDWLVMLYGDRLRFMVSDASNPSYTYFVWYTDPLSWVADTWHHVVVTFDGVSNAEIYLDGVLQTLTQVIVGTWTNFATNPHGTLHVADTGIYLLSDQSNLNINELVIFERVISLTEVEALRTGGGEIAFDPTQDYPGIPYSSSKLISYHSMQSLGDTPPGGFIHDSGSNNIHFTTYDGLLETIGVNYTDPQYISPNTYSLDLNVKDRGDDSILQLTDSIFDFSPNKPFSISAHINFKFTELETNPIIWRGNPGSQTSDWQIYVLKSLGFVYFIFEIQQSSGAISTQYYSLLTLDPATWYHIAITFDGTGIDGAVKIYVDGESQTVFWAPIAGTWTAFDSTPGNSLYFGQMLDSHFVGEFVGDFYIDQVTIFGRVITENEVEVLRTGNTSPIPPPTPSEEITMKSVVSSMRGYKLNSGMLPFGAKSATAGGDVYGPNQAKYGTDSITFRNRLRGSG